jgi:hypothetical protein
LSVREWVADPRRPGREPGWALVKSSDYARPVRRLALRWRKRNGQWCHARLISTLKPEDVLKLIERLAAEAGEARAVLSAYARLYDERGGGVEIEIKESKQGLGCDEAAEEELHGAADGGAARDART